MRTLSAGADATRPTPAVHIRNPQQVTDLPSTPIRAGSALVRPASVLLSNSLVFCPDSVPAVCSFEPPHGEMTFAHFLKMLDECVVHCGPTQRSDDWQSLSGDLLRHHRAKARCDLGDEADENRSALFDDTPLRDEACRFGYRLCQHPTDREVATFRSISCAAPSAQRKNLHA